MTAPLTDTELKRNRRALAAAHAVQSGRRLNRIEDYLFIGGDQMSARQAAQRLGVAQRTITRYRKALREAAS